LENGRVLAPAVALRLTAGYAFHTPSGVKSKKESLKIHEDRKSAKIGGRKSAKNLRKSANENRQ
jgi:hypothetical protein